MIEPVIDVTHVRMIHVAVPRPHLINQSANALIQVARQFRRQLLQVFELTVDRFDLAFVVEPAGIAGQRGDRVQTGFDLAGRLPLQVAVADRLIALFVAGQFVPVGGQGLVNCCRCRRRIVGRQPACRAGRGRRRRPRRRRGPREW